MEVHVGSYCWLRVRQWGDVVSLCGCGFVVDEYHILIPQMLANIELNPEINKAL